MKKYFFLVFFLFAFVQITFAQKTELLLRSSDKGPYLVHKVNPKESFFSIGRLYNLHPKSIAGFNRLDINKGLAIGQIVNIPLTDTNFIQKGNKGTPVYYKVGDKEGLMKVSAAVNDVSLIYLRQWNALESDIVNPGAKLIVGFLHSNEMPAVTIKTMPANNNTTPNTAVVKEAKPKEEEKPKEIVKVKEEPVKPKEETVRVKEEPVKPQQETTKVKEESIPVRNDDNTNAVVSSFFKPHYDQQVKGRPAVKNSTVTSGIFKTTSGWLDSKYYLLIDGVQPGTIVKISNPANNKMIYAKVLGEMSGIRQNEGLNIRISSAAASVLQIGDEDKFILNLTN
jgi:LysM repeat protein